MANCPVCGTTVNDNQFLEKYISPFNNQEYKLYHCPNCDLQWWEPLKMIPELYENDFFEIYRTFHSGIRKKLPYYQEYFFKNIPLKSGKLLDIGCGDGLFLEYAKKSGFEVYGIDLDKNNVKVAKERLKSDKVYTMSLDRFMEFAKDKNLKFDIITFFEVLEHQDNPKSFLKNIKNLLSPKGVIAGSVPNRDSFFTKKLLREIEKKVDYPPHHFLRFSRKSLDRTLKISNFEEITIKTLNFTYQELFYFLSRSFFPLVYKGRVKEAILHSLVKTNKFHKFIKFIRNIILTPFTIYYIPLLKGNGLSLFFYAKKGTEQNEKY